AAPGRHPRSRACAGRCSPDCAERLERGAHSLLARKRGRPEERALVEALPALGESRADLLGSACERDRIDHFLTYRGGHACEIALAPCRANRFGLLCEAAHLVSRAV